MDMSLLRVILILLAPLGVAGAKIYEMVFGLQIEPFWYVVFVVLPLALVAGLEQIRKSGIVPPSRLKFDVTNEGAHTRWRWHPVEGEVRLVTDIVIPFRLRNKDPHTAIGILDMNFEPTDPQVRLDKIRARETSVALEKNATDLLSEQPPTIGPAKWQDYIVGLHENDSLRDEYKVRISFRDNYNRLYSKVVLIHVSDPLGERFLTKTLEEDADKTKRQIAARKLGQRLGSKALPVLSSALVQDENADVRYTVLETLASIEGKDAVSAMFPALNDPQRPKAKGRSIAGRAAELIGERGRNEAAVDALVRVIGRYQVAKVLGTASHESAPTKQIAFAAAWSLAAIVEGHSACLGSQSIAKAVRVLATALDADHPEFGAGLTRIGYDQTAREVAIAELVRDLDDKEQFQTAVNAIAYLDQAVYPFDDPEKARRYALSVAKQESTRAIKV